MLLSRIPVRVIAENVHEYQAFADILGNGSAGALTLALESEVPYVTLVCPSGMGQYDPAGGPAVILGGRRDDDAEDEQRRNMPIPAALADVLTALEGVAQDAVDTAEPRQHNGWTLEPVRLTLRSPDGRVITLTDTEVRLLAILFDVQGEELDKDTLLQRVWGYRPGLDTHTLETHVYRLRQKIETNPTSPTFLMTTEAGYRLQ
ncbi:MAG: helix-turn-helix domain-containing protein [Alphaproteobacteria bacterium]|nr:helix-turn-helix domain-containing protein [Alphaproteobacteria bacterium]